MPTPSEKVQAALSVIRAVIEAIEGCPDGITGGTIFAALSEQGCTLQHYEQVMGIVMETGRVRRVGRSYFPVGA